MKTTISAIAAALLGWIPQSAHCQAPANDQFTHPQVIGGVSGTVNGNNSSATLEAGEPATSAGYSSGSSVWFRWPAPANGSFTFSLTADFDSQLAIYTGGTVASLISKGESDLFPTLGGESVSLECTVGTIYQIRVTGYGTFPTSGSFVLNWGGSVNPGYERIHSFVDAFAAASRNKGRSPTDTLVQGRDGNLYGTTSGGGALGCGTVFRMTLDGALTTLVEFTGNEAINKGKYPTAGLTHGNDGNFYGTTSEGGALGYGTVFRMTQSGMVTTLVEFTNNGAINKGCYPSAGLVLGRDGNFYGTTRAGGSGDNGTVFRMTPSGVLTTLVEFTGNARGRMPSARLVQGSDENFYGTTSYGGEPGYGTVFKMTPSGTLTTLVNFAYYNGAYPSAELLFGGDGNLYGVTSNGGAFTIGTVFKVTLSGVLTTLVEFTGNGMANKGRYPYGGLRQGNDGNFYGTTSSGGSFECGTVFKMTPYGELTTLVEFAGSGMSSGKGPQAPLLKGRDGDFYGTTGSGGAFGSGTVFKMSPSGGLTTLVEFTGNGANDKGGGPFDLMQSSDGSFYGTTLFGGTPGFGTVYRMTPDGQLTTLAQFTGDEVSSKGAYPYSGLAEGIDGNLYGTSSFATPLTYVAGAGTVYRITPTGLLTTLVEFSRNEASHKGKYPATGLVRGSDGSFYGTTSYGGAANAGTVFKMTSDGTLTTLVEFDGINNGTNPENLLYANDGNIYGTTAFGSPGYGTVFKISTDGTAGGTTLTTLVVFTGNGASNKGGQATARLVQGTDGNFYGTTNYGGGLDYGTIFKMNTDGTAAGTTLTTLVEFTGNSGSYKGRYPRGGLVQGIDGNFYGTTEYGGGLDYGTVFKMTATGVLTTLVEFTDSANGHPAAPLIRAVDGNLYGTTLGNFVMDGRVEGSIYRLIFPGPPELVNPESMVMGVSSVRFQAKVNARGVNTALSLEYGVNGVDFPDSVPISSALSGFQTTWVGTTLDNFAPGTTYYYRFSATSSAGTTVSPAQSFSTLAPPTVTTTPATDIQPTSARLNGTVNARNFNTTYVFEWGTDANRFEPLPATAGSVTGNTPVSVSALIPGLVKGTTYYYRIVANNAGGESTSGVMEFTTLVEPEAITLGAVPDAYYTTRARVMGKVDPKGSVAKVTFEYREMGAPVAPISIPALKNEVKGGGLQDVEVELRALDQGKTYEYRAVAVNASDGNLKDEGEWRFLPMRILSGLNRKFPDPPPTANGSLTIHFSPATIGAWRFVGEDGWRLSGEAATHLVGGSRTIEYLPVPGFTEPERETVGISGSDVPPLSRSYLGPVNPGTGSLTVTLQPMELTAAGLADNVRARWKFEGESGWKESGISVGSLPVGVRRIECSTIAGSSEWVAPAPFVVAIGSGTNPGISRDYTRRAHTLSAISGAELFDDEEPLLAHVGQVRTGAGSGSGFAVKPQVVATVGHAVFDDTTMSYIPEVQWLHQRYAGVHQPIALTARGYYLLSGYARQRREDGTVGASSPAARNRDCAALFFLQNVARSGYSGFLASEAEDENEFLATAGDKFLAGYPVDGVTVGDLGKPHVSSVFIGALQPASGETWTTTTVLGAAGCSGGPLFVRHANGSFYPAAIYLGGTDRSVLRAIDRELVDLFDRAQVSAPTGDDGTGGGMTYTNRFTGDSYNTGKLRLLIGPQGARTDAHWSLRGLGVAMDNLSHDQIIENLRPGLYLIEVAATNQFHEADPILFEVNAGVTSTLTYTFASQAIGLSELDQWRLLNFGSSANEGEAADNADPDGDGSNNLAEYTADTNPKDSKDRFQVTECQRTASLFTLKLNAKMNRTYVLEWSGDLQMGTWEEADRDGPFTTLQVLTLSDSATRGPTAFYRVRVEKP